MNTFDQLKMIQREHEKAQEERSDRLNIETIIKVKSDIVCTKDNTMLSELDWLRNEKASDIPTSSDLDGLPMDWRIEYEERAAILEYDGGLSRVAAEAQALTEIRRRMERVQHEE